MNVIDSQTADFDAWYRRAILGETQRVMPALSYLQGVTSLVTTGTVDGKPIRRLPWQNARNIEIRAGEVSIWAGVNGHGKSLLLGQVMTALMRQGEKACIASFEMSPEATLGRMALQAIGSALPSIDYIQRWGLWTADRLWLYDQSGLVDPKTLLGVALYCADQVGITHLVIDSLMKCGIPGEDLDRQAWFVNALMAIAKDTGCHIHLVAHSRKRQNERDVMDKFDVKGSGTITDAVHNVFTVWRNKKQDRDESEPDAMLCCDKQRTAGWEGRVKLWFRPVGNLAGQFVERADRRPMDVLQSVLDAAPSISEPSGALPRTQDSSAS